MHRARQHARPTTHRKRIVRTGIVVFGLILLAIGVLKVGEIYLNVDQYRFLVSQRIQEATGLPITVGKIELAFTPLPRLNVSGCAVRTRGGRVNLGDILFVPEIRPLFRREIRISDIRLASLDIRLRDNSTELPNELSALRPTGDAVTADRSPTWNIAIDRLHCEHVRLDTGGDVPIAAGSFELRNLIRGTLQGNMSLQFSEPISGKMSAEFTGTREGTAIGPSRFTGEISLVGVDISSFPPFLLAPAAKVDATAVFHGTPGEPVEAVLSGRTSAGKNAPETVAAVSGPFTAAAIWADGTLAVKDIALQAPGGSVDGALTWQPGGPMTLQIASAQADYLGLASLLDFTAANEVYLATTPTASVSAKDWVIVLAPNAAPQFVAGTAVFEGIQLSRRGGEVLMPAVKGLLSAEDGEIRLRDVSGDGVMASGRVFPDLAKGEVFLECSGTADLAKTSLVHLYSVPGLEGLKGKLTVERLAGTLRKKKAALPTDFDLHAKIQGGEASMAFPSYQDRISDVSATIEGAPEALKGSVSGHSGAFGPISADGEYQVATRTWTGEVSADLSKIDLTFVQDPIIRRYFPPLFSGYGPSKFSTTLSYTSEAVTEATTQFSRQGTPELSGNLTFAHSPGQWRVQDVRFNAAPSLTALGAVLPEWLRLDGVGEVSLVTDPTQQTFAIETNLTSASMVLADLLNKPMGTAATLVVRGTTPLKGWQTKGLDINLAGQDIAGTFGEDGRLRLDLKNADLGAWSSLYQGGLSASGRVSGWAQFSPLTMEFTLDKVAAAVSQDIYVQSVSGLARWETGRCLFQDMTVQGANSDLRFTGALSGNTLEGRATGPYLDVNALLDFILDVRDWLKPDQDDQPQKPPTKRPAFHATLQAAVDRVLYRRAEFQQVSGTVEIVGSRTTVRELVCTPYTGTAKGTVDIVGHAGDTPGHVQVDVMAQEMDARAVDELLFAQPRMLKGSATGEAHITIPIGPHPMSGVNGTAQWEARDGTLGKMGMSTKLLSFVRTTDLFRLKFPPMKDEGLVFDQMQASTTFTNGVLFVDQLSLINPVLSLAAEGNVDFPADSTDLRVHVAPFQTLGEVLGKVPLVGLAFGDIRRVASLNLAVSGPPDAPSLRLTDPLGLLAPKSPEGSEGKGLVGEMWRLPGNVLRTITGK